MLWECIWCIIMDKVDFTGASFVGASLRSGVKTESKKTRVKGGGLARGVYKSLFSDVLEKSAASEMGPLREFAPSEEALTELMDAVHSTGSDLIDRPFHDEILRYKRAVRDFIHYVVENGYEKRDIQGISRKVMTRDGPDWARKPYVQIQVVDRKLEELAAAILSGQTTQMMRVSKLDEITGLLVDLTITGAIRINNE